jgi:hypothetical protein
MAEYFVAVEQQRRITAVVHGKDIVEPSGFAVIHDASAEDVQKSMIVECVDGVILRVYRKGEDTRPTSADHLVDKATQCASSDAVHIYSVLFVAQVPVMRGSADVRNCDLARIRALS